MYIQIVNQTTLVSTLDLQAIVDALGQQIMNDFYPAYAISADLEQTTEDNGDWPIYIVDSVADAPPGALAWHTVDDQGRPYGIVPLQTVIDDGYDIGPTISHELLELLADPYCITALLANYNGGPAMISYEVCDPVENDEYEIGNVPVSNFVLPNWFVNNSDGPWDQLGKLSGELKMTPGGYFQYFDGAWQSVNGRKDAHYHSRFHRRERILHEFLNPGYHKLVATQEKKARKKDNVQELAEALHANFGIHPKDAL